MTQAQRREKGRGFPWRWVGAAVAAALAAGLTVYNLKQPTGPATLLWAIGAVMLAVEAALLWAGKRAPGAIKIFVAVLCALLMVGGYIGHFYAIADGKLQPIYALVRQLRVEDAYPANFTRMRSLESLDMVGSTVTDFTPIRALTGLKRVDLRQNYAFDRAERDALAEALPECDIRWSVPVQSAHFDSAAPGMDLTGLSLSVAELKQALAENPDKKFIYNVPLLGRSFPKDAPALDLTGAVPDVAAIEEALALLPEVQTVDLRGVPADAATVAALWDAHPEIHFMFTCAVPGPMTTEDETVTAAGSYEDLLAYMAFMPYMPNLVNLDASGIELTVEQMDAVSADPRAAKVTCSLTVCGVKVSRDAEELNLDGVQVADVGEVEEALLRLPNVKRVSMCYCGVSEADMGRLFDAFPGIKFVWWLEFGHYRLRTDATAFTTALGTNNRYGYDDETFACLRYCTDLQMLDLGHNKITSLENFRGLKKLRVLIMADNKLTDIAPIADFTQLEYVELFLNDITDVTPLTGLTRLMDLNIFYNPLYENFRPLESMTWLKRLWIGGCRLSRDDRKELAAALPDTQINTQGRGSTGKGWRNHPHYDILVKMYDEERYIPFEDSLA